MKVTGVIARLNCGDSIVVTHKRPDIESDRDTFCLKQTGRNVGKRIFERLLQDGEIEPEDDGLPGFGVTQTYRKSVN